jgi:hypothetical protein
MRSKNKRPSVRGFLSRALGLAVFSGSVVHPAEARGRVGSSAIRGLRADRPPEREGQSDRAR